MNKGRLEAFSDGVIAIIITIMVLELRPPHGTELADLAPLAPAIAYYILVRALLALHGADSTLAVAIGSDLKGKLSIVIYLIAIGLAFVMPILAGQLYFAVAMMWLVPDRRIERVLEG